MEFDGTGIRGWLTRRRDSARGERGTERPDCGVEYGAEYGERLVQGAEAPGLPPDIWRPPRRRPEVLPGQAVGIRAVGALGLGAGAGAALALGALALGAVAIGALAIGRARVRRLDVGDLTVRTLSVGRLHVGELVVEREGKPA